MRIAAHIVVVAAVSLLVYAGSPQAMQTVQLRANAAVKPPVPAFQGQAAEQFLANAEIIDVQDLGEGVTRPRKVALEFGGVAHNAVFKWIDERKQGQIVFEDGSTVFGFRDTWETEVAAYRVDRMIGLGMVPATIERAVQGDEGSLQWWVDAMMSEEDRLEQGIPPPDMEEWIRLRFKVWLFDELVSNADRHTNNILITEDFDVRLIDHSRSFRENRDLQHPEKLTRFSRSLLEGLERLTFENLKAEVGRHLSDSEIERLLDRRDDILELARARAEEFGEAAVFYP